MTLLSAKSSIFLSLPHCRCPNHQLILLIIASRKRGRQALLILSILVVYWSISWVFLKYSVDVRATMRWLFRSKIYKAEVLELPRPADGDLRHMEWDGWGFPGAGRYRRVSNFRSDRFTGGSQERFLRQIQRDTLCCFSYPPFGESLVLRYVLHRYRLGSL